MLRRAAKDEGLTGNLPLVLVSADGNDDAYERYGWRFNSGQSDVAVVILPKGWARPRDVYRLADQEAMLLEHGGKPEGRVPGEWKAIDFDKFYAEFFGYRAADEMVHASTLKTVSQPAS